MVQTDSARRVRGATRIELIEVAERLFALRGIDAVSLSEIIDAAGQRNKNAVHYHFGGKDGLIAAIAAYRSEFLNSRRSALLDDIRARGREDDIEELGRALVLPLVEMLDIPGSHFLGFLARYHLDRSRRALAESVDPRSTRSYLMAGRMLARACGLPRRDFVIRYEAVLDMLFMCLAGHEVADRSASPDQRPSRRGLVARP